MTMNEVWDQVNIRSNGERLVYLYERWLDEREYEDIGDYLATIQTVVPGAYKMTKRPFGFKVRCEDGEIHVTFKIKGNYVSMTGTRTRRVA